jgi:CheY-like chemotaxis protein
MRILIVDDYQVVRQALRAALEGYDVEIVGEAASGNEAVRMCEQLQPDVIILDLYLTDADGFTTIKRIRETCKSIKSILLTNSADTVHAQAKAAGFDAVLGKASSTTEIGALLQTLE